MGRSLTATRPAVWLGGIGRSACPRSRQDKDSGSRLDSLAIFDQYCCPMASPSPALPMSTISLNTSLVSAVTLLGGEGVLQAKPRVVMDWIPLVRRGLLKLEEAR